MFPLMQVLELSRHCVGADPRSPRCRAPDTLGDAGTRAVGHRSRHLALLIHATLRGEDKRFYHHPGVVPVATARGHGRSKRAPHRFGGSPSPRQLAGLLWPEPRSYPAKLAKQHARCASSSSCPRIISWSIPEPSPVWPHDSRCWGAVQTYFLVAPDRLGPAQSATMAAWSGNPAASMTRTP